MSNPRSTIRPRNAAFGRIEDAQQQLCGHTRESHVASSCVVGQLDSEWARLDRATANVQLPDGPRFTMGRDLSRTGGVTRSGRVGFTDVPQIPPRDPYNAFFVLPEERSFLTQLASDPARANGIVSTRVTHNRFWLDDERQTGTGEACGTHYVLNVTAGRRLSYGVAVDFPSAAKKVEFDQLFGGVNAVIDPPPSRYARFAGQPFAALRDYLQRAGAKLSFHVYVSKALAALTKESLRGEACTMDQLERCPAAFGKLADFDAKIGAYVADDRSARFVTGRDETLDQVTAPGSTWGIYDANAVRCTQD